MAEAIEVGEEEAPTIVEGFDPEADYEVEGFEEPAAEDGEGDDTPAVDAASEAGGDAAEQEAATAAIEVEDPRVAAALARLAAKEKQLDSVVRQATQPAKPTASEPPVKLEDAKNWTAADMMAYINWQRAQDFETAKSHARAEAEAAASELRLRGELNPSSMGEGWDYDSVVGSYVAPMMEQSPALAGFISQMSDPAASKYSLGMMLKLAEANGGDRVKTMQRLRDFMTGKGNEVKQVKAKAAEMAKRGAAKVQPQAGAPSAKGGGNRRVLTAQQIMDMAQNNPEAYKAWRAKRGNPV